MKLPELSSSAAPQFVDAASCKAWLEQLPLANVGAAQQDLLDELEEFNGFPTSAANRLGVLETVREAVNFVQIEQAKRFMNRPLPMAEAEEKAFDDTIELWEQMRLGYLRCLEAALARDAGMRAQAALITQRLGAYIGLKMFHCQRAYRELSPDDWRGLHQAYAHAERLGVAEEAVKDYLNRDIHDTSPRVAYARAVLMALSNPHELAQRQITFVAFLLERWAVKLEISSTPVLEEKGLLPLVADLAGERCPSRGDLKAAEPRFLDTRKLAKSLRNRVGLLRKGESPAKLALGEDCVQPSCEQLLVYLFRQWCQMRPAAPERSTARRAQVCTEVAAIHHYISGGAAQRAVDHTKLTQTQRLELETLGRIRTAPDEEYSNAHGFMLESWLLDDDSPLELRIRRPAGTAGKRYSHGQLVAVRPAEGKAFHVGQVRWLLCAADGELRAGIKRFPGVPSGVTLRGVGLNETERSLFGLSLAAVASTQAPATLVLPMGAFKPGRVLEVQGEKPRSLRLTELVERGADFDRVAYEPA
ncbi:MAG TPA: hypothetical protein VHG88_00845 [Burkholderiales bacterium]|nr:hypothetical protein [Burkholderiales bacterium]